MQLMTDQPKPTKLPFDVDIYHELQRERDRRKLELYRPYVKQQQFHKAGGTHREILLRAGNQCLGPWSLMETDSGLHRCGDIFFEEGACVQSWGGESQCTAQISYGILRGIEPAFRIVLESGRWFDCSSSHQILTEHGYCRIDELMSLSNGLRLIHKREGYQASCVAYGYLGGQLPQLAADSVQDELPSQADVQRHSLIFSHEDAEARIYQYTNFFGESDLHSIFACGRLQREALYDRFAAPKMESVFLPLTSGHQKNLQLLAEFSPKILSSSESVVCFSEETSHSFERGQSLDGLNKPESGFLLGQAFPPSPVAPILDYSSQEFYRDDSHMQIFYPLQSPQLIGGERIIAYVDIGFQPIVDCHVPNTNNYILQGVIHHNCGKTYSAAAEIAMHATGKYAPWWEGRRFKKAPVIWCAGVTGEVTRDTIQRLLVGDLANPGTGLIPAGDIVETVPSRGVAGLMDTLLVKHTSGQNTRLRLKNYEQGREKFQADSVQIVWLDEECDIDLYMEALTRTNATGGFLIMTFTPLKGMSQVVRRFLVDKSPDRCDVNMTIEDALHIPPAEREKIIASYPAHERAARLRGVPMMGSGLIFPVAEELIACDPIPVEKIPNHWQQLGALDFGWDHPTAAVKILHNTDDDIIYVTGCYRRSEATPMHHASALKPWGNIKYAWPHDGLQHDKGSGIPLADMFRKEGLDLLPDHARFPDGSNSVEAGILEMLTRMETGRFKVYRHLAEWFEEFRMYHRSEGKIKKEYDDILCLHPKTKIITDKGAIEIASLVGTSGKVLTRNGKWAKYKNCRLTRKDAELVKVTFSDGHEILCTPNHKLLSTNNKWICAIDSIGMVCHDAIANSRDKQWKKLNMEERFTGSAIPLIQTITSVRAIVSCIVLYMKNILEKSLLSTTFITGTGTREIMTFLIWNVCWVASIYQNTIKGIQENPCGLTKRKKSGENLKRVKNFFMSLVKKISTSCASFVNLSVSAVGLIFQRKMLVGTAFAPILANPSGAEVRGLMMFKRNAVGATPPFFGTSMTKAYIAQNHAEGKHGHLLQKVERTLSVLQVKPVEERSDTYCMEVMGTHAMAVENGAIVHNCASRYSIMCLRFATYIFHATGSNKPGTIQRNYDPLSLDHVKQDIGGVKTSYDPLSLDYLRNN